MKTERIPKQLTIKPRVHLECELSYVNEEKGYVVYDLRSKNISEDNTMTIDISDVRDKRMGRMELKKLIGERLQKQLTY